MTSARLTFPIEVTGGLVTNDSPLQQGASAPGSARKLINFEPSIEGGYRRINGFTKWDTNIVPTVSSSAQVLGVGFLDGAVITAREGKIFTSTGSGWTERATGRTQTTKHRYNVFNFSGTRKIMGIDTSNYPYTWDGSSFVNLSAFTDVEGASNAVDFKDHMFYSKADLVTYSKPFDETDFTVADGSGSFRMPGTVTGFKVFRERLFIFTEEKIMVLDGTSDANWALTSVSDEIGCIAQDTIQEVGGDVAFLAADGIRMLGATAEIGSFNHGVASKNVQKELVEALALYSQFDSTVVRGKSQYRLFGFLAGRTQSQTESFIGMQSEPSTVNSVGKFHWSIGKGIKVYGSTSSIYNGDEYVIFCGDTEYVHRMESGDNFDGTGIDSSYYTPYLTLGKPLIRKTMFKKEMYFNPEGDVTGTLNLRFDFNDTAKIQPSTISFTASGGGSVFGTGVYGTATYQGAPDSIVKCQLIGSGFNVSLEFEFLTDEPPFIIDTILLEYSEDDRS